MKRIALTIAASDTSGGAGIQADLRAFSIAGVHGYSVITCLTAQTPDKVYSIIPLDAEHVENQVEKILDKVRPDAIKIGMVYSKEILSYIADLIEDRELKPIVADPVFKASDGTELCEKGYIDVYERKMLPLADLLTPNLEEAKILAGGEMSQEDLLKAIHEKGSRNVLLKGGHFEEKESTDILFDGKKIYRFSLPRILGYRCHGTGCTFSSLIAGNLAKGRGLKESIDLAKRVLWSMILNSYSIAGNKTRILGEPIKFDIPPPDLGKEEFDIWFSLNKAVKELIKILSPEIIPEVGINIGYALRNAKNKNNICALDGRITKAKTYGTPKFGASKHIASIILTAMKYDRNKRSAMNIRYSEEIVKRFEEKGFLVSYFEREKEPDQERSTMEWGTKIAIERLGRVPDVIWDKGGHGKEPMIRVIGNDPFDLVSKIREIL